MSTSLKRNVCTYSYNLLMMEETLFDLGWRSIYKNEKKNTFNVRVKLG